MSWVMEQDIRPAGLKFTLVALANHADARGVCWPSQATLVKHTGHSERTVGRHIQELEDRRLIERRRRHRKNGSRRSDLYRLTFCQPDNLAGWSNVPPYNDLPDGTGNQPDNVTDGEATNPTPCRDQPDTMSPLEPSPEPSTQQSPVVTEASGDDETASTSQPPDIDALIAEMEADGAKAVERLERATEKRQAGKLKGEIGRAHV